MTLFGKRIALLLGVVLATTAVAEALLRGPLADRFVYRHPQFISELKDTDPTPQIADALLAPAIELTDSRRAYRLRPDFAGRLVSSDFDVSFETNSNGFRSPELRDTPGSRLLALGDSFTMGFGVEQSETFVSVLARLWAEQSKRALEPLNAGVVGYNPWNSYEAYLELLDSGKVLNPELVMLQLWAGDDLCGPDSPARPAVPGDEGAITRFKSLLRRSHVAMLVRDALRSITPVRRALMDRGAIARSSVHDVLSTDFATRCGAELTALGKLLAQFDRKSRQRDARFVVVLIPMREQVYPQDWERAIEYAAVDVDKRRIDFDAPNRAVAMLADRHAFELLDLTSALRDHRTDDRLYFSSFDPHMTPAGHAVVGRALAQFFLDARGQ